jgi:BirA family biotin operon repressor/biotin-[acetyl-CoA-carboxylase] ligase
LVSTKGHSVSVNLDGRVRESLAAETRFADIRVVTVTGSTNDDLVALAAAGAPEGVVLCADFQSAGRGRLDRTWQAQPGDALLVSVLLRPELPPERRSLVASAVAVAARAACGAVAGVVPDIKWPNDLLAPGGPKLAGILAVEASGAVVVGMGLNVHDGPPGAAVLDGLAGRRVSREALLERWLRELDRLMGDWDGVADRYRRECATVGRVVSVSLQGGTTVTGTAEEIDPAGLLVLRTADGRRRSLAVGDVTHLR